MADLPTLHRLDRWLRPTRWAGTLGAAGYWLPVGALSAVLGALALVFAPVLVHGLWRLRRWGWLAAFGAGVGGALAGGAALAGPWLGLRGASALVAFYALTWALSLAVADWLREAQEDARWAREKARTAAPEPLAFQA